MTLDETVAPPEYNYKITSPPEKGERPGLTVFLKEEDKVFHTYSTYARGLEGLLGTYALLDMTPLGRQEKYVFRMTSFLLPVHPALSPGTFHQ